MPALLRQCGNAAGPQIFLVIEVSAEFIHRLIEALGVVYIGQFAIMSINRSPVTTLKNSLVIIAEQRPFES